MAKFFGLGAGNVCSFVAQEQYSDCSHQLGKLYEHGGREIGCRRHHIYINAGNVEENRAFADIQARQALLFALVLRKSVKGVGMLGELEGEDGGDEEYIGCGRGGELVG